MVFEVKSRINITSLVSTKLGERFPDKVVAIRKKTGDAWKVSLRNQSGRLNLGDAVKKSVKGIGSGWGHEKAAAAPVSDWEKFLAQHHDHFDRFDYDVHLGRGLLLDPETPDYMVRQVLATTRKRVDVIGHTPEAIWIIEIKPRGGQGAVGQLQNYRRLYLEEYRPDKPVLMVLVCERLAPDVRGLYDEAAIGIIMV